MAKDKKPCVNFERGNCPYGNVCKFSHDSAPSPKKTKLCYGFTKGRCNRGSSCQYSHDIPASGSHSSRAATPATHPDTGRGAPTGPTAYDQFVQWRYDIKRTRQDIKRAQPLGRRFPDFIQQALILVDAPETMQEVITSLSDEGGLERLGELLNADFSVLSDKALQSVFKNQLLPFFQIVAHEAVLSSAVLESRHATLLNYLYGVNGKRSVTVFCAAIRALTYDEQISADFEPCLIALSAVLEVNGSAQINDDLRTAAELMIALAKEHDLSGNSLKYHRKMCLRLGLGEDIRHAEDKKKQSSTRPKPTFELAVDQPGELSEHGPRHDNDCEDIQDIQILPTIGETLGERAECLPRSDSSTWHLPGIAGLLDRQFRLIREDTIGQLRDAAKVELNRIQHGNVHGMGTRHAGARTYSYRNVRLVGAEFDEHKGLLCALQFDQPRELDGKSAAKRKDWWFESNRLAPEALIMLLGSDQILEHLVDADFNQVIRIDSRSKSERLLPLNLRTVAQKEDLTKLEKRERWQYKKEIGKFGRLINDGLGQMQHAYSDQSVLAFLKEKYPDFHAQLSEPEVDEEGFELVRPRKAPNGLEAWLQGGAQLLSSPRDGFDLDLFSLKIAERRKMYVGWKDEIMSPIRRSLLANLKAYEDVKVQIDRIRAEVDLRVLKNANVIGVTTSGLARNLGLLRRLNSKVLLVEEAGEVLEAHLLTAMLPSIEHAILIGDHQQLRPKAQNYDLSCENPGSQIKLDISLFERLVHPEHGQSMAVPYVTLEVQRRMHPSISTLIRSTLYPDLQDSPQVAHYPEVSGMRRRLFWLDHEQSEDRERERSDSTSHTNQYEVDMVFALVRHLVRQGVYRASDIAVLTPYLGQLRKLRRALSGFAEVIINDRDIEELAQDGEDENEDDVKPDETLSARLPPRLGVHKSTLLQALRLATVDNFQGEEAKVVIISLVRCNQQRKCGFLRTSNRINVLLSRAQHGMYIIGNTDTSSHVPMWGQVLDILSKDGNVGTSLDLCCPRHPKTPLQVTSPDDFSSVSPEAGCDLLCGERLPCGHSCVNKCHSDGLHKAVYCTKPCNRVKKGCNHNCQYECGRLCDENCNIKVANIDVELPCGHHVDSLPCWQYQDPKQAKCCVVVDRTVPGCNHTVKLPCYIDVGDPSYICTATCASIQPCGHACKDKCCNCRSREGAEITRENHGKCLQQCGRDFTNCKHVCAAACHGKEPCPHCNEKCDVECSHARCSRRCSEPCTPCAEEECASCCPHSQCNMPCAAPCDWVPCSERCKKNLRCGHQCLSVCGADCPSTRYCQICTPDEVKNHRVDLIMLSSYAEVDLSENPCIFLPCGDSFTVESLDGVMAMSEYYELDDVTGMPTALNGKSKAFSYQEIKACPDCRSSLRLVPRYGRITRRALLDESTKKFITWSNREYSHFAEAMQEIQDRLMKTRTTFMLPACSVNLGHGSHVQVLRRSLGIGHRYHNLSALRGRIDVFLQKTAEEAQPLRRVHDLVEALRRRLLSGGGALHEFDFDQSLLQMRGTLLATALAIRCEILAVSDFTSVFSAQDQQKKRSLNVDFSQDRDLCEFLIEFAATDSHILQQTEGHIFWAHLAGLECEVMESRDGDSNSKELLEDIKRAAEKHLGIAEELCVAFPGQTSSVVAEIDDIRRLLREAGYQSQMRMVVAAMQGEFSGTGHWYRCENGHPFTVGECGMPMQTARCPQCNAPIGGSNHQAAEGVQHAGDIELEFGNMRLND